MLQLILGYLESPVGQPLPTFPGKGSPPTCARSQASVLSQGARLPSAHHTVWNSWGFYHHQDRQHTRNSVSFRVPRGLYVDPGVEDVDRDKVAIFPAGLAPPASTARESVS